MTAAGVALHGSVTEHSPLLFIRDDLATAFAGWRLLEMRCDGRPCTDSFDANRELTVRYLNGKIVAVVTATEVARDTRLVLSMHGR
jgi:hypothetical protein